MTVSNFETVSSPRRGESVSTGKRFAFFEKSLDRFAGVGALFRIIKRCGVIHKFAQPNQLWRSHPFWMNLDQPQHPLGEGSL